MSLWSEPQKEILFGVLENVSQDLGFWSIMCVTSHVILQKIWLANSKGTFLHFVVRDFSVLSIV